jgi:hypothetical protein
MRLTILSDAEPLDLGTRCDVDVMISCVSYIQSERG